MSSASGISATTASTQFLAANPRRAGLLIKAPTANTDLVYVKLDSSTATLTAANGMPIDAGGSLFIGSDGVGGAMIGASELGATCYVMSNTGTQDFRFIEFTDP